MSYSRSLALVFSALAATGSGSYYLARGISGPPPQNGSPGAVAGAMTNTSAASLLNEGGAAAASTGSCGKERWAVKTLTDPDASKVNFTPIAGTITALASIPAPAPAPDLPRQPQEQNVYTVQGTIVAFKQEKDSDIHLAIADPAAGPHPTMIAEFPARYCETGAVNEAAIDTARDDFTRVYGQPTGQFQTPTGCVTVTGVFFFDRIHGQLGVAPNGGELHPVIAFQNGCITPFPATTTTSTTSTGQTRTTSTSTSTTSSTTSGTTTTATPTSCSYRVGGELPDPACTPGATNPAVTQANIQQTICMPGYTHTIRPKSSYTTALKRKQMAAYGATGSTADYEEDHLIALEVGGNPIDPRNLWPQPRNIPQDNATDKDQVENTLHRDLCAGKISLAAAQHRLAHDWRSP